MQVQTTRQVLPRLGAALLSWLPTSEAVLPVAKTVSVATVAASTMGCSGQKFDEDLMNTKANERAAYHLKLSNSYYNLLSEFVRDKDKYNLDASSKENLLKWHQRVETARQSLLDSFNSNDMNEVLNKINSLGRTRPTEQQEQAHYYYRQLAREGYFEGLSNPAFFEAHYGDDAKPPEPTKTSLRIVQHGGDQDLQTEMALTGSLAYYDSTKHPSIPWGYSSLGSSELYDFGIQDGKLLKFGENKPDAETLKRFGRR